MVTSSLETQWTSLRRYRGVPPKNVGDFFTPDAELLYLPTSTLYSGQTQIEALLRDLRATYHHIRSVQTLSTVYSESTGTVVEESLWNIYHGVTMEWFAPGIRDTGEEIEIVICTVSEIRGGKISKQRVYWDHGSVLKQMRVMPQTAYNKRVGGNVAITAAGREVGAVALKVIGNGGGVIEATADIAVAHAIPESVAPAQAVVHETVPAAAVKATGQQQLFPTTSSGRTSTKVMAPPGGGSNFRLG
ncbi:hypothetical protein HK102_003076 [Quaeritorhiza haematococci]|nr:hypothetical protein HK102_003076 [Quaeritorhiza haematococci]